jgi:formate dehydrogenase subunit gamma
VIADVFNISQAEVRGIVSFYDDFRSRRLTRELETSYATSLNSGAQDAPDDLPEVVLEPVYCLGLCAVGPAAEIDGRLVGRATVERLEIPS